MPKTKKEKYPKLKGLGIKKNFMVREIITKAKRKLVKEIVEMMENKKDRSLYYDGKTMCEYWITVLKAKYLKVKTN